MNLKKTLIQSNTSAEGREIVQHLMKLGYSNSREYAGTVGYYFISDGDICYTNGVGDKRKVEWRIITYDQFLKFPYSKEYAESYKDWQVGDKIRNKGLDKGEIIFRSGKLVVYEKNNIASRNLTCEELYLDGWRLDVENELPKPQMVEVTIEEIAKLKGVDVNLIRIKEKHLV